MQLFQARSRRSGQWVTEIAALIGMLIYVGIVELIVMGANPTLEGFGLVGTSIVLAIIPAAIWLFLFYVQDREEPEPTVYVVLMAVLGAILAASIGQPLIQGFFRASEWLDNNLLTNILGSILVVGFIQEFLKYAGVRFSMYYSAEFDQRMDGVIYGTAIGLGYGTMLNILTVINSGGVNLGVGVINIVVTALVQGSLGGFTGYFLGRNKIDAMPVWWMPVGVTISATLNGLFTWLSSEITRAPITIAAGEATGGYNPWPALIAAIVLALLLLAGIFALIRSNYKADEGLGTV
ncbi:MAG: PrsW family glutamic-type intramembrane protease [Chloroflexota bacterium]|nr:PrsW family glutamic-type intramembrane protease [Chloroflexota bacterium]